MISSRLCPVTLRAPAKINLFLLLTGRTESGLHLIESVFCFADDLYDEIKLIRTSGSTHSVRFINAFHEVGPDNTVTRALGLLEEYIEGCFDVTVVKNLPVAAGVGGGSADAAALLNYFGDLYKITTTSLEQMALSVGFDTVVCLYGRPCHVTGMGDKIIASSCLSIRQSILLVCPRVSVSASTVYKHFRESDMPFSVGSDFKKGVLTFGEMIRLPNDLTDSAIKVAPIIKEVLSSIESCPGNEVAKLCGSGPTCMGLFDTAENLNSAYLKFLEREECWVKIVHISL